MTKIRKQIIEIIADELNIEESEVTENASFVEDFEADSLDVMELILRFEDEFDIEIPDSDVDKFNRVGEAIQYVENLLKIKTEEQI